ncbi:MAG: DNA lyase [Elusimicrobia bacterium]|nr:DNA lyase [Elusimicrobiota bacterium]
MRLWSLHPSLLDSKGLVALWREALLAQKVLAGKTKGYRHHPQLERFRAHSSPRAAIAGYLRAVREDARRRGYRFNARLISTRTSRGRVDVTRGQLRYEWGHLRKKLRGRDAAWLARLDAFHPRAHPLFRVIAGGVESWERP